MTEAELNTKNVMATKRQAVSPGLALARARWKQLDEKAERRARRRSAVPALKPKRMVS